MINALTVDLEDWAQSVFDVHAPITEAVVRNAERILAILEPRDVKATFFVLGLVAEKFPALIRRLHGLGHEIQSHGYGHRPVHAQSPREFRDDVRRSKEVVEQLVGTEVTAYRAPQFSIGAKTRWAWDVLAECGYRVDSSLFPVRMRRYGSSSIPRTPFRISTCSGAEITEMPVACWKCGPMRVPAGGGGYLRLLPFPLFRRTIRQLNDAGHSAVLYVHPYEVAPDDCGQANMNVPRSLRLTQSLGRRRFARRLARLLDEFQFGRLRETLPAAAGLLQFDPRARQDSNLQPSAPEADALSNCATGTWAGILDR